MFGDVKVPVEAVGKERIEELENTGAEDEAPVDSGPLGEELNTGGV